MIWISLLRSGCMLGTSNDRNGWSLSLSLIFRLRLGKYMQRFLHFKHLNNRAIHIMKNNHLLFGLLVVSLMLGVAIACPAQDMGRFQGTLKGSALPGIYWHPHYTADVSFGYRFNEKRYVGFGTGYHMIRQYHDPDPRVSNGFVPAIPLFVDYVRYIPSSKHPRNSFFLGMEAGGGYYVKDTPLTSDTKHTFGYVNGKMGFDFSVSKNLGVILGCNLIWGGGQGLALTAGFRF